MKQNNILNFNRLYLVLKRDIFINLKTIIIAFGVLYAIFLIPYLFGFLRGTVMDSSISISESELSNKFYVGFFILGLLLFAGNAFKDFRTKLKTQNYLLIPASTTEKFVSVLAISTIGYILTYFVTFMVFNVLLIGIGKIFSDSVAFFNVFADPYILEKLGMFLVFQSMFLAGAATFQKSPFLKTPLIAFTVSIVFMILLSLAAFLTFQTLHFEMNFGPNLSPNMDVKFLKNIGKALLYITPFVFWAITFFKLKEKQV